MYIENSHVAGGGILYSLIFVEFTSQIVVFLSFAAEAVSQRREISETSSMIVSSWYIL